MSIADCRLAYLDCRLDLFNYKSLNYRLGLLITCTSKQISTNNYFNLVWKLASFIYMHIDCHLDLLITYILVADWLCLMLYLERILLDGQFCGDTTNLRGSAFFYKFQQASQNYRSARVPGSS